MNIHTFLEKYAGKILSFVSGGLLGYGLTVSKAYVLILGIVPSSILASSLWLGYALEALINVLIVSVLLGLLLGMVLNRLVRLSPWLAFFGFLIAATINYLWSILGIGLIINYVWLAEVIIAAAVLLACWWRLSRPDRLSRVKI